MYTIMVSDDEKIERDYIKSVINKYPDKYMLIGEASNGQEIIELAFKYKPDIIIMDIKMPIYNGLEASKIIKLQFKNIIIILNSAYAEFEFAKKAIDYNLNGYLLKPSTEKIIIDSITSSINKQCTSNLSHNKSDFLKTSKKYPNLIIESIIKSMYLHDINLIENNINLYFDFFKIKSENTKYYKFHIINTMFSVITALQDIVCEKQYNIIYNLNHLLKISRTNDSYEILNILEDFFDSLLSILIETFKFNSSCEDIIQNYIDKYFQQQITLENLSNIFHFNPSYISRTFHKHKKITISAYINKKRIEYATNLLKNSNMLIKDIAFESGFINISHFNKVFKDTTGQIPSNVKKGVIK